MLNISPAPVSSAGLAFGTIARVQSATGNTGSAAGSATSFTITFGGNLTVGNLLVVGFVATAASGGALITDPGGAQQCFIAQGATGSCINFIAFMPITAAGTIVTVTNTLAGTFNGAAVAVEYSGATRFRSEEAAVRNGAGSGTTATTSSLTTTGSNDLLIAVFGRNGTFAVEQTAWLTAVTNSFSSVAQSSSFVNSGGTDRAVALCERFVTSSGVYSAAGTQASANWNAMIAAFVSD